MATERKTKSDKTNCRKSAPSCDKGKTKKISMASRKKLASLTLEALKEAYPTPACALHYDTPFQLLVAVVLSAQCTDVRVNLTTPALFAKFPTPKEFAQAPLEEIENLVKSCGFYRTKAENLSKTAKILVEKYDGEVPNTMEELVKLPGVGRKTANCILGNAFRIASGFVVDTHVLRLSRKIGFTDETTPEQVEKELILLFPKDEWIDMSHRLIYLGREYCVARRPRCESCPIFSFCLKRQ